MYDNLGIHWASSIPAFLALACVPFPFLFYKYGPPIRVRCKYAGEAEAFMKRLRGEGQQQPAGAEDSDIDTETDEREVEKDKETAESPRHGSKLEETEEEAEAFEYSAIDEPRFAPIQTSHSQRLPTSYDENPYDIDRVNTLESFGRPRSRSSSVNSGRSLGVSLARTKSHRSGRSWR